MYDCPSRIVPELKIRLRDMYEAPTSDECKNRRDAIFMDLHEKWSQWRYMDFSVLIYWDAERAAAPWERRRMEADLLFKGMKLTELFNYFTLTLLTQLFFNYKIYIIIY